MRLRKNNVTTVNTQPAVATQTVQSPPTTTTVVTQTVQSPPPTTTVFKEDCNYYHYY